MRMRRWLVPAVLLIAAGFTAPAAAPHPFGNESVTRFSVLYLFPDRIEIGLLLDIAEIPSLRLLRSEIDADADGLDSPQEQETWLNRRAKEFESGLRVEVDGRRLPVRLMPDEGRDLKRRMMVRVPGEAGLPTYRLMLMYAAENGIAFGAGRHVLAYRDDLFPGTGGMKRVLLFRTEGFRVEAPHPPFFSREEDPFDYARYDPENLPQVRSARVVFESAGREGETAGRRSGVEAGAAALPGEAFLDAAGTPGGVPDRQARRIMGLIRGEWGMPALLAALLSAFTWGASHALAPGHAKTLVAAYLISRGGTFAHAAVLALVVTFTHTAAVVAAGVAVWVFQAGRPGLAADIQAYLGVGAGLLVAALGLNLALGARGNAARGHAHPHSHAGLAHSHRHKAHAGVPGAGPDGRADGRGTDTVTFRSLIGLGVSGGMVPCPTAVIIMLLGIGAGVVPESLFVIGVFSLGLASTLMLTGILALSGRMLGAALTDDRSRRGGPWWLTRLATAVPALSGVCVALLGLAITAHYAVLLARGFVLFEWLM